MGWTITWIWSVYLLKILFFDYSWLASRNKSSFVGKIWFSKATGLSGCSSYSDADHLEILIQQAESVCPWQPIYMKAHEVFLRILCWKAWCAGRTQGFSSCSHCSDDSRGEPALQFVLWKSQTCSPVTGSTPGRWLKRVEAGGEDGRAAGVGMALLPPGQQLPGTGSLAK